MSPWKFEISEVKTFEATKTDSISKFGDMMFVSSTTIVRVSPLVAIVSRQPVHTSGAPPKSLSGASFCSSRPPLRHEVMMHFNGRTNFNIKIPINKSSTFSSPLSLCFASSFVISSSRVQYTFERGYYYLFRQWICYRLLPFLVTEGWII